MFDRDAAFSMKVCDPDNQDDNSPIVNMLTLGNEFLIFKSLGIYRGLTADTIDPERKYPDTRHSCKKLYSIGANNIFVARMILQFEPIIDLIIANAQFKHQLVQHVWESNKLLLDCEKVHYCIYKEVMELAPKCDQTIEMHKRNQAIPALPQVEGLNINFEHFLSKGKQFLVETYKLFQFFFDMPFNDKNAAHFDKHQSWLKHKLGDTHQICEALEQDNSWIRLISEARNALQHPKERQKVEIDNFTLKPGNKFTAPAWRYDLTNRNCGKRTDFVDIVQDFNVFMMNMLAFFEDSLILCLKARISNNSLWDIYKKQETEIDFKLPILYVVGKRGDH
jgi:hypothetical protein